MDVLPNEIILNIFNFLDRNALKEVLSVNKRFRELIITNSVFMRKLPVKLSKNYLSKIEFANNYGDFVKELDMEFTTFESFDEFKTVLNLFPNIEKIRLNYIYIKQPTLNILGHTNNNDNNFDESVIDKDVSFTNLKSVYLSSKFFGYITQIDSKILSYLNTNRLEEILINLPMQKFSSDFLNFLFKQNKLTVLQVYDEFIDSFLFDDFTESLTYNQYISSLFEIDLSEKCSFQLKKLSINYRGDHRENFQKFLCSQNELDELEIKRYEDDFVRFKITFDLIKDFNVRKLTLPLDLIQSNILPNVENYINQSVVELTLKGYNNDPLLFNLLLKIFPNIKKLRLEYMLEFSCDNLATLANLEVLIADHFKIDSMRNVQIKKLKRLEIGTVYPFIYTDWEDITKVNTTIEEIIINEVSHFNTMTAIKNSVTVMLRDLKKISYLKIIQNESTDCLRIVADMKKKMLMLSPYAMKMLKEIFTSHSHYDAINLLF